MHIDLTPIFQAIIALLAALVTYKLIPWIKARTTESQQALLSATVRTLVYAAEQLYGAGEGAKKLDYVIAELEKRGFAADRAEIEAAVAEAFNLSEVFNLEDNVLSTDADSLTATITGSGWETVNDTSGLAGDISSTQSGLEDLSDKLDAANDAIAQMASQIITPEGIISTVEASAGYQSIKTQVEETATGLSVITEQIEPEK